MADVGMTNASDYLAAEVELASARQQKLETESSITISNASLNIAIGEEVGSEFKLTGSLIEKFFPIEPREELLRIAFANRPDFQRLELAVQKSREQTKAVNDAKLPGVNAFGNFGYSSPYVANGSTDYTVGVNLTYTIFDAGRKHREVQSAEAETVARLEKEKLANQIRIEVIKASQAFETSRAKIMVSMKSIALAEEALRIVHDRYNSTATTFNEVLRAEAALVRAKSSLVAAQYEFYISNAAVLLATGRLTDVRSFD
jgi:outer membrane protein TolC